MKTLEIKDLKDMLKKSENLYGDKSAYKVRQDEGYKIITYKEVCKMVNAIGTKLIDLGLKDERIAIIGENRYEWEIAYLSIVCGTGIVVPLDKSLPENEIEGLIKRAEVTAIFYSKKYKEQLQNIYKRKTTKLKYLFPMEKQNELIKDGEQLLEKGNKEFLEAKIEPEKMNIMLFTSGTTSQSKAVALSHKNICSNLMDLAQILDINSNDRTLSFLPLHHVFECTVGFLLPLYRGCQISFCDGIKHILENFKEYETTFAAFVPAIYENIYKNIIRKIKKHGNQDIKSIFGGHIKMLVTGAASIDPKVIQGYRNWGINLCQAYGLTETSPIVGIETSTTYKLGSIGKALPSVKTKIEKTNNDGIGELLVKGPNVMLGYYQNEEATKEAIKDGWFHTGDFARIDEEGYIFIHGRKKNVIVLKNGKNIFPEEMENLINQIYGVKETFIFGKSIKEDKNDIKIYAKIVYDKQFYKNNTEQDVYKFINEKIKEINHTMPPYKGIKGIILTQTPLIKTSTSKIKRQEEMKTIL